jgi:hypothetical protein
MFVPKKNITPHAVQAFVFDEQARVRSSLIWGRKSPYQKNNSNDIAPEGVLAKKNELLKAGFDFKAMKNMLDQGESFKQIVENLSKALDETASQSNIKNIASDRSSDSFVKKFDNNSDRNKSFAQRARNDKTKSTISTGASKQ